MQQHCHRGQVQRGKAHIPGLVGAGLAALLLAGCATKHPTPEEAGLPTTAQYIAEAGVRDDRGHFRELFCTSLEEHGQELFGYRACEESLVNDPAEPAGTGAKPELLGSKGEYLTLIVPGLGWECLAEWLDYDMSGPKHIARFGFEARMVPVAGLSSSEHNARQIRDYIAALPEEDADRKLILLGYSKGAPDALVALASYPEVAERVVAMVSLAGAVKGSPLADDAKQADANLLTLFPGSKCEKGDEGAVDSLKTAERLAFLEEHELPEHIAYYSIVTSASPERISFGLRPSYNSLSKIDPRNDSQLLFYDQMIPGSTLLALLDGDHWAVAVPVAENHEFIAGVLVDQNKFPREALMEATVRYIELDLAEKSGE